MSRRFSFAECELLGRQDVSPEQKAVVLAANRVCGRVAHVTWSVDERHTFLVQLEDDPAVYVCSLGVILTVNGCPKDADAARQWDTWHVNVRAAMEVNGSEVVNGVTEYNVKSINFYQGVHMQTCTQSHLTVMGCPLDCRAEMVAADLPQATMNNLVNLPGFAGWVAVVAFVRKWGPTGVQLLTAIEGGVSTLIPFLLAHAADAQALIADLLTLFGPATTPAPSPITA